MAKMIERVKIVFSLAVLLADIGLTFTCCVIHFMRGDVVYGRRHGGITLAVFCVAGLVSNLFHFIRHELPRMPQRRRWGKVKPILLIFLPCYYLLLWNLKRLLQPNSLTLKCWTASLRLFYSATGSLIQSVFQSYLVVRLWWEFGVPDVDYTIMIATAIFLCLQAIYSVCWYIWVQYYDETGTYLLIKDIALIIFALSLNMCGRVAAMAIVMGTLGWEWLLAPIISPFLINLAIYLHTALQNNSYSSTRFINMCRCINLIPMALLSSMTISDKKFLTILTTLAWIASYLPQILVFHAELVNWLVWVIPTLAQLIALIAMMCKWEVFEGAFHRFSRVASLKPDAFVSPRARKEKKKTNVDRDASSAVNLQ